MTRPDLDNISGPRESRELAVLAEKLQKRIEETEASLKNLMSVKRMIEEDAENRGWIRCPRGEAEQHRSRVLTGSVGLACPWEPWKWGVPERCPMNRQFEYRRRRTRKEIFEAADAIETTNNEIYAEMLCRTIEAIEPGIKRVLDWHGCNSTCQERN